MKICAILAAVMLIAACGTLQLEGSDEVPAAEPEPVSEAPSLMTWPDLLSRPRPEPDQTLRIGPGATDIVDLWLPEGAGPFPTVIMIHGGCWQKSIADRTLMNYAADALRQEGMAVWNIEYRGVDEEGGGYPGTFLDVARAVDALGEMGPDLGLETGRVAAIGHSAGGHLALWAASRHKIAPSSPLYSETPFPIAAVVNSGGLAALEASAPHTLPDCLASIMDDLTGAPSEARPNVFSDTSPSELLPSGVFVVSVNGADDRIAPPLLGEGYTKKAIAAGDEAEVIIVPATGHVELVAPGSAVFELEVQVIRELSGFSVR